MIDYKTLWGIDQYSDGFRFYRGGVSYDYYCDILLKRWGYK